MARGRKQEINVARAMMLITSKPPLVVGLESQEGIEQRQCRYDMERKTAQVTTGLEKMPKLIGIAMPQL